MAFYTYVPLSDVLVRTRLTSIIDRTLHEPGIVVPTSSSTTDSDPHGRGLSDSLLPSSSFDIQIALSDRESYCVPCFNVLDSR